MGGLGCWCSLIFIPIQRRSVCRVTSNLKRLLLGNDVLMSVSRQCSCHHEAGHAVAWIANGYSLRLVVGHSAEGLSPEKQSVWEEALGDPSNYPAYATQCIRRARSGGAGATSILLPTEHTTSQTSDDRDEIREMLQKAFTDEQQRTIVYDKAEQQADTLIKCESNAVRALAKELLDRGALWGCEAEQITRKHLSSS